jgi:hypothetical protein
MPVDEADNAELAAAFDCALEPYEGDEPSVAPLAAAEQTLGSETGVEAVLPL